VVETDRVPRTDKTVAAVYTREKKALLSLPTQPFGACRICTVKVNKMSTVTSDTNQYSVPCVYAGQTVWVKGFADRVVVVAQNEVIARQIIA